jgi:phosphatidylserine/phosphatidylglycerophosphate/cardiolipin synthase-like enzyme
MKVPVALVLAALAGSAHCAPAEPRAEAQAGLARVEAAFTPGDDIEGLIASRIDRARFTVQMQAYLFTNRRIGAALVAARKRGVAVEVVGDATQHQAGGLPMLASLDKAGAAVYLNAQQAASHNKVVIVDGATGRATVITGSYNFTQSAQSRNAENVVVISGNRALTDRFVRNFERHRAAASRLQ